LIKVPPLIHPGCIWLTSNIVSLKSVLSDYAEHRVSLSRVRLVDQESQYLLSVFWDVVWQVVNAQSVSLSRGFGGLEAVADGGTKA